MFTYQMREAITLFIETKNNVRATLATHMTKLNDIFGVNIQKHEEVRRPKFCNKVLQIDEHGHIHLNQESSDVLAYKQYNDSI
jgi:hypothetical protein